MMWPRPFLELPTRRYWPWLAGLALLAACAGQPSAPKVEAPAGPSPARLLVLDFTAAEADPAASEALGRQQAMVDGRVQSRGQLVVHLHGAGAQEVCGSTEHLEVLAGLGFHVLSPCYRSDYGIDNCGDDVGACRLEAFDGVDRHPVIAISRANSIEGRVAAGLAHLRAQQPDAGWGVFLNNDRPRWDRIVLSGMSHGASSAGVIAQQTEVARVVMLSGPSDRGQAWLTAPSATPAERQFAFSHTGDRQHGSHLEAWQALGLPGEPVDVGQVPPPYLGSHRLITSATIDNAHGSTRASSMSPRTAEGWGFAPVWAYLYGAE